MREKKKGRKLRNTKENVRINKCWNTIRFIVEHDYFVAHFL